MRLGAVPEDEHEEALLQSVHADLDETMCASEVCGRGDGVLRAGFSA